MNMLVSLETQPNVDNTRGSLPGQSILNSVLFTESEMQQPAPWHAGAESMAHGDTRSKTFGSPGALCASLQADTGLLQLQTEPLAQRWISSCE